jgi:aldehyde dehydrogenase (NAD+)
MIEKIVEEQRTYFKSGKTLDVNKRLNTLKRLKTEIKKQESRICDALQSDLGKCAGEAYMAEIGMVLEDLSCHIKHLKSWARKKKKSAPLAQFPSACYSLPSPYGCTLVISPWNYPFLLTLQPLVGAVAAGNTAIVKPSRFSANTSKVIKEIVENVFAEAYVAVIYEEGASEELLKYKFDYIFFTGGAKVGQKVYEAASKYLTPVTLELGGKSPVIVDETAKIDLAAKRIAFGKFLNVGQTCIAPDYALVHEKVADEFVKALKKWIKKLFPNPFENPQYGKIISEKHFKRVTGLIGGNLYLGGTYAADTRKIEPTIIYPATTQDKAMQEEIFGPILPVLTYKNKSEIYDIISLNPTPLALYLFTTDRKFEREILTNVSFGGGCVNDTIVHIATTSLPFGGVGNSGINSYHGKKSFETFSHYKSVLKKSNLIDLPIRYTPYTKFKNALIKIFMR